MSLLVGALTMGLILALMSLGVFVSFRIFGFADLATDSILTLGAAVAAVLLVGASPPGLPPQGRWWRGCSPEGSRGSSTPGFASTPSSRESW